MMQGIEIKDIHKSFQAVKALDGVSLVIEPNKIYGLLGRNGAGKTTLLNVIMNRIFPNQGSVLVDGEIAAENDKILHQMFLMSEKTLYPEGMRVGTALEWAKEFNENFDLNYAKELAKLFELSLKKKIKTLSTGYLSIFKLIVALSYDIPYVLLDEPVLGLDANHRELFYKVLLESYANKPRTIVISTHLIEEVSHLIEEVVMIKEGKIICQENCEDLLQKGYSVSGRSDHVDAYCVGKEVIGFDTLGSMKIAYLMGKAMPEELNDNIEVSKLDLQKLFVQMTN